jgi:putative hemolysin
MKNFQFFLSFQWKNYKLLIIPLALIFVPFFSAQALRNPAAVYCTSMGYSYVEEKSGQNQCQIPETKETFPEWDFYAGKVGQKYGYCAMHGYEVKTINSPKLCLFPSINNECAVCIIAGEAVPIATAMKLSFAEAPCGDGKCSLLETALSCPGDCPSGADDGSCDGKLDGKCDPNCTQVVVYEGYAPKPDPDCNPRVVNSSNSKTKYMNSKVMIALVLAFLLILGLVVYYFRKRAQNSEIS